MNTFLLITAISFSPVQDSPLQGDMLPVATFGADTYPTMEACKSAEQTIAVRDERFSCVQLPISDETTLAEFTSYVEDTAMHQLHEAGTEQVDPSSFVRSKLFVDEF